MRAWEILPFTLKAPLIDIGAGNGPLQFPGVVCWDKEQGDATFMHGVRNDTYQTVYSHHCLEHLDDPITGLKNWWRILKHQGYLIVTVPHRNYYEKRRMLPSIFNSDHRTMWLPDRADPPNTFSLLDTARQACRGAELILLRVCTDGYIELPDHQQSPDGFHLEIVLRKP